SNRREFAIRPQANHALKVKKADVGYFSFFWNKGSHYFKTEVGSLNDDLIRFALPSIVFRSNKRSYQRKPLMGTIVSLKLKDGGSEEVEVKGVLLDISRRGFLCEVDGESER